MSSKCAVCLNDAESEGVVGGLLFHCERCGEFRMPGADYRARIRDALEVGHARKAVSAWVRRQTNLGETPELTLETVGQIAAADAPDLIERGRLLLFEAVRLTGRFGETLVIWDKGLQAITWSDDERDVQALVGLLKDQGFVEAIRSPPKYFVTAKGLAEVATVRKAAAPNHAFVAMSFDPTMRGVYDYGIHVGISRAGYTPIRVDRLDHLNRIDDEIIAQIRRSRFVVADFTMHRAGVYFEAGFALGLGREVIWTCRRSDIPGLHFDVRQYNCIDWETPEELAARLQQRIEALIGAGPVVSV